MVTPVELTTRTTTTTTTTTILTTITNKQIKQKTHKDNSETTRNYTAHIVDCLLPQEIREELLLEKKGLSATLRKLTSANDRRPSAQAAGGFAIVMLVVPAVLIVFPDVVTVVQAIAKKVKALRKKLAERKDKLEENVEEMNADERQEADVSDVDNVSEIFDADDGKVDDTDV